MSGPGVGTEAAAGSSATAHLTWPADIHAHIEWELDVTYRQGYADGIEHARQAMNAGLEEATGQLPGSAKEVVDALVRAMNRAVA